MTTTEQAIINLLEKFNEPLSVENIALKLELPRSQVNSALYNLEKRGRANKENKDWVIGSPSIEQSFLKVLGTPKKAANISIEADMTMPQVNKILYSLETSGLAKRTVSNPPIWSLVDEKDELIKQITLKLATMDVDSLKKVLELSSEVKNL